MPHLYNYKVYDFIYETRFGAHYQKFTDLNLSHIRNILPSGKILDVGCGTGRLAIPLNEMGYDVVGIDLSEGMLAVMKEKIKKKGISIPCYTNQYELENQDCDLILAVFTVLAYTLDRDNLLKLFKDFNSHLKPNGKFLFDLAQPVAFNHRESFTRNGMDFRLNIRFVPGEIGIANYDELVKINTDEFPNFESHEEFRIRNWGANEVQELLTASGFGSMVEIPGYAALGAKYYIVEKV